LNSNVPSINNAGSATQVLLPDFWSGYSGK